MAFETFDWCPRTSAQGATTYRKLTAQFGDGYAQEVRDGINAEMQRWSLQFVGKIDYVTAIKAFLDRHGGWKPFIWTPPFSSVALYFKGVEVSVSSSGADVWTLSVTFQQSARP